MSKTIGQIYGLNNNVEERIPQIVSLFHSADLIAAISGYWAYRGKSSLFEKSLAQIPIPPSALQFPPLFGVEVETENVRVKRSDDSCPAGWTAKGDGSLRHGAEYISYVSTPEEIRSLVAGLYLFFIEQLKQRPDFSWRTSIHVHVNIRNFTSENVANLQLLYSIFEFLLFKFVGGERDKSIFCVPITESEQYTRIRSLCVSHTLDPDSQIKSIIAQWEKYSALNFSRISDLGTVEFRHMSGTWDTTKIGNWLNLIGALQDAALRLEQRWIVDQINGLNSLSNYGEFQNRVFGVELSKLLGEPDTTAHFLSAGVSWAKKCLALPPENKIDVGSPANQWITDIVEKIKATPKQEKPPRKSPSEVFVGLIPPEVVGSLNIAAQWQNTIPNTSTPIFATTLSNNLNHFNIIEDGPV